MFSQADKGLKPLIRLEKIRKKSKETDGSDEKVVALPQVQIQL